MKQVAREFCGTGTYVCALESLCALGSPPLRRYSPEPEGAPPLVSKGGLLRSNAKVPLLFAPSVALP
jgi:hypothetical protein